MREFVELLENKNNAIFIGGAGSGKSEIALNLARYLSGLKVDRWKDGIDLFDLDQTKPLYRSRDLEEVMKKFGVRVHYQEQHMDSPQAVGGVGTSMANTSRFTILDVGGDDIGARLVGSYQTWTNRADTIAFYVINPYRPWSEDIYEIDSTLSAILAVSHIKEFHIIANANLGHKTTAEDWLDGLKEVHGLLDSAARIEGVVLEESLHDEIVGRLEEKDSNLPFLIIKPMIDYGF